MHFQLTKPELEAFVARKVKSGDFPSPEAVVEDALARAMEDEIVLSDDDVEAINEAAAQFKRGEGIDFKKFAEEARKEYGIS
jgi:Arc/MetJ-type ribon-helix-helix transcriptional regulator